MSAQLLEGLSLAGQLLMQLAARHEVAPLHYARVPPLDDASALAAAEEVQERGLLKPAADAPALYVLTPVGYSLCNVVMAQLGALHEVLRPKLVEHVRQLYSLDEDAPAIRALRAVDRGRFLPEGSRPLADLDLPAPIGIGEMTTSAPHAIVAILRSVAPQPGDRVLVCGAKAGMTIALCSHLVGASGQVTGLDDHPAIARFAAERVAEGLGAVTEATGPAEVRHVSDVTLGLPDEPPFQVIILNGSIPKVPRDLLGQLSEDGRLLVFLQEATGDGQTCYVMDRRGAVRRDPLLSRFVFTPIYGRWGWDRVEPTDSDA